MRDLESDVGISHVLCESCPQPHAALRVGLPNASTSWCLVEVCVVRFCTVVPSASPHKGADTQQITNPGLPPPRPQAPGPQRALENFCAYKNNFVGVEK
ncbi:hypothetical protein Cadr_000020923 [Camelus dromedarius]|uniref:Uncharacterized protein n=1 Tax=Camelus dromedarius TaxID=9838 RepID=A0A5N4CTP9_CAMDR|nr:hypothetical protein Cadr_000020923 [Camelus dromedarius]